ncbi:MAG: polyprenyl synthetase family protein [Lentisphaerae bacterium]|nr:polyprenyl synthetase family protein [Lentisphaerota bacterium]
MLNLVTYLNEKRQIIDHALDAAMPAPDERPTLLHQAMRYSVFSGGKRLRPILCMAASNAINGTDDNAITPAIAVELIHSYTLIHDDLPSMDNDDTRRGKPTVHRKYGEANAVLAGDALQALAFEILADSTMPDSTKISLIRELAGAAGSRGVVGGQVEDIAAINVPPDADTIRWIHLHKTADLFRTAVRMGAIAGNATAAQVANLGQYAESIGLAFQITDDILDANSGGKRSAIDTPSNCMHVLSAQDARKQADEQIVKAMAALKLIDGNTIPLEAIAQFVLERTC